jgi:hypothetical protein
MVELHTSEKHVSLFRIFKILKAGALAIGYLEVHVASIFLADSVFCVVRIF